MYVAWITFILDICLMYTYVVVVVVVVVFIRSQSEVIGGHMGAPGTCLQYCFYSRNSNVALKITTDMFQDYNRHVFRICSMYVM